MKIRGKDMKNQVEFKPPSDFVADDSGGGNNVWKYLGIGCGVVLLIVGIAFAFGAWKTASCCGDAMDAAKQTMKAQQASAQFADKVSAGDTQEAYALTSEAYQNSVSLDEFQKTLSAHAELLRSSPPRPSGVQAQQSDQSDGQNLKANDWTMKYEFSGPQSSKKLVMTLNVMREGEGEDAQFFVDDMRFDERRRVLSAEPPAEAVTSFHRHVRRGNYGSAYDLMGPEYSTETDRATFEEFVGGEYESAYHGDEPEIRAVDYGNGRAVVIAETVGEQGATWRIEYELKRGIGPSGWVVSAIAPQRVGDAAPAEPDGSTEGGGEKAEGEQAADEGAETPEDKADESGEDKE
ncbi:MAG: hypothetical protein ACQEVA_03505 [Myxococcota bacterium]